MDELLTTRQICAITGLKQSTIACYTRTGERYDGYQPKLPVAEQRIEKGRVVNYYRTADFADWWDARQAKQSKEA